MPDPVYNLAPRVRRGFTFIELMLGLMVTALIMGALSAVLAAVAQGWKQSDDTQFNSNLTSQAHLRIQRVLKSASLIGAVRPGAIDNSAAKDAALLIWKADTNRDWRIQFSEVALLEYHPDGATKEPKSICYYQLNSGAPDSTLATNDELYLDSNIDLFKASDDVSYSVLARNVLGCAFHKNDSYGTTRPSIEYMFELQDGSTTQTDYGAAALRTPATMPVSER